MFGIDDAVSAVSNLARAAIERIWPDATEVEKAKLEQLSVEIRQAFELQLKQIETNIAEIQSGGWAANWRPALGWVCVGGFGYEYLARPLLAWGAAVAGLPVPPEIAGEVMVNLLVSLLGLGTLRTVERIKGKIPAGR